MRRCNELSVGFENARGSALKALELNSDLARAHLTLGSIQYPSIGTGLQRMRRSIRQWHSTLVIQSTGRCGFLSSNLGNLEAGVELCRQAVARDPVAALPRSLLALSYLYAGQLDEAENEIRATLEISPEFSFGRYLLGVILLLKGQAAPALELGSSSQTSICAVLGYCHLHITQSGQQEASDAVLKKLIEKHADVSAYQIVQAYAYRGEKEKAFDWLDRAYRQRDPGVTNLPVDPLIKNIKRRSSLCGHVAETKASGSAA